MSNENIAPLLRRYMCLIDCTCIDFEISGSLIPSLVDDGCDDDDDDDDHDQGDQGRHFVVAAAHVAFELGRIVRETFGILLDLSCRPTNRQETDSARM